jgi:hypothetical protein
LRLRHGKFEVETGIDERRPRNPLFPGKNRASYRT